MRDKAMNALIEMGMPANIKGFQYIMDAMELYEDETWRKGKIVALYHWIAKLHNTSPSSVERAIRHSFGIVTTKGNLEAVKKYLTLQNITNGNLLQVFYLRLIQEA